jgi:hypothetical protein
VASRGEIHYGTTPALGLVEKSADGDLHFVQLAALSPETTYYYKVVSETPGGVKVDDNKGKLFTFKTSAVAVPNMPYLIHGKIEADGKPIDAIVYATVERAGELSQPISTSSEAGLWLLNLGNLRGADGKAFAFAAGDTLRIEADGGASGLAKIETTVTEKDLLDVGVIKLLPRALLEEVVKVIPKHNALLQNYPNPFNPETWIPYQLASDASVTISIYNLKGQLVRELSLGRKEAGVYVAKEESAYWDGRNNAGERVSTGLYFYQIQAGSFEATKRMVILK